MLVHLAAHLRAARAAAGITQEEMAEKVGFEARYYQRLESGQKRDLQLSTLVRIGVALNRRPWEFLAPVYREKAKVRRRPVRRSRVQ